jgi:PEP-CTERM/exosortase A-associated glycosyltransferase
MRILHVLDHSIPLHSGYTFRTLNIVRQQRKLGWETCHVTGIKQRGGNDKFEEVDGLRFYRTTQHNSIINQVPVLNQIQVVNTLAARLDEVIDTEKPDLLHAHSPALNGLAALRAGKRHGLPVVYECRAFWEDAAVDHGTSSEGGLRYRMTRALETRVFRAANAVTTICEGLRQEIISRGVSEQKITVIPNGVDVDSFHYSEPADAELVRLLGLAGKTVIGFIGSFYAYEGIPLMLEALPAIAEKNKSVIFLLVGGGPEEELIKRKIEELGLQDKVIVTGRVPHEEVHRYYSVVDVFTYPRLSMRLTDLVTPLKPLEAMAQGRLVVASDVGGHRELIEDGKTGVLFKADDAASLASAVCKLLDNRHEWQDLREAGRKFVEQERSWQASVGRYVDVYNRLL